MLAITYSIAGEIARLRVPPPRAQRMAHELWKHTCCECFVALKDEPEYYELNFAPSGEWTAYAFARYREGAPLTDEALNPRIAVRSSTDKLELGATIPLERLSPTYARGTLSVALSAVVEEGDGVLSYWALRHPAGKADFHHPDAFVLEINSAE